jgi:palmitoyltransferase
VQYLGPSAFQLFSLFFLVLTNSLTLFTVGIMFIRSAWCLGANTTTIEGWEIDRHEVLLRRAKVLGGHLEGPNGVRIRIRRQEFPYDIGIWANICQGMNGTPLTWFWPLASAPPVESGLEFEVNGFEDEDTTWPPPDPDRMSMKPSDDPAFTFLGNDDSETNEDRIAAFRARQEADMARRRRPFHDRYNDDEDDEDGEAPVEEQIRITSDEGEESWRSLEGERLADFGVDEDTEFYDEDNVPLARLIARGRSKVQ